MKGKILNYNIKTNEGIISTLEGTRYRFSNTQWNSEKIFPSEGLDVDFNIEDNEAKEIYCLNTYTIQKENEPPAIAIISLVFGIFGVFSTWWSFAIPSIIAVITGHLALSKINNDSKLGGKGFALAGLICGYLIIGIYILVITVFVSVLSTV